jgi:hypothetical protein
MSRLVGLYYQTLFNISSSATWLLVFLAGFLGGSFCNSSVESDFLYFGLAADNLFVIDRAHVDLG